VELEVVFEKEYIMRCSSANELLETDVEDDCLEMMSSWCRAGKLRKLWEFLSDLRSSVCARRMERAILRPAQIACQNCTGYSDFPSGMTSHSKIAQFNWQFIEPFTSDMDLSHLHSIVLKCFDNFLCSNQVIKPIILANTSDSPPTWRVLQHPTFLHLTHTVYLWISSYAKKISNPQTKTVAFTNGTAPASVR
jgi:hypothetical protein